MKTQKVGTLHKILEKNAFTLAIFFWVDGAIKADPKLSPRKAIQIFVSRFEVEDVNIASAVAVYNRAKSLYIKNNHVL